LVNNEKKIHIPKLEIFNEDEFGMKSDSQCGIKKQSKGNSGMTELKYTNKYRIPLKNGKH